MSSYLSSLLTHTTSRYNNLRRTLLANEEDGDTPDDSHISRVLRAYYNEKGRPLPPWLPPDPNDRRAQTPVQQYPQQGGYGGYGSQAGYGTQGGGQSGLRPGYHAQQSRGSLNDLWDSSPAPPTQSAPQSLRAGRRAPGGPRLDPSSAATAAPRPLPSQRAGSYQSTGMGGRPGYEQAPPSSSGSAGGGTAQERLKARLWGGRSGSPGPGTGDRVT